MLQVFGSAHGSRHRPFGVGGDPRSSRPLLREQRSGGAAWSGSHLSGNNSEAVRRKSRDIELGHHFSHFCATLGIPPTTGPRGSLPMLRDQMQRLFASTFQCVFHDENEGQHAGDGFLIADKRILWWDPRHSQGDAAWGSHVVLSERFFREATEAPVPLDLRVLRALRSPFEIDIYVWLTWRFFRLRRPVTIPWPSLMLQFGCGYANPRHFKNRYSAISAEFLSTTQR